jgi:transposase
MKLTKEHYGVIEEIFPTQRRKSEMSNLEVLNAVLYVLENGCKWRSLPREYGNWNTIYVRLRRWSRKGILQKAFMLLQEKGIIKITVQIISLDSTSIKVHPDGTGALKNTENSQSENRGAAGTQSFIWLPHPTQML